MNNYVKKQIKNNIDIKYRDFTKKLLPNVENIMGVRLPILRKIAKSIDNNVKFLENVSNDCFEETMIEGFVIGNLRDKELVKKYTDRFIPKINNWSICDSFCSSLKIVNKNKDEFFEFLCIYKKSSEEFILRFMIVMFLNYYIDLKYLDEIFKIINEIKKDDYYVEMAIAWFLSISFVKYPEFTLNYLNICSLDKFTYNKTIQKIIESKQVNKDIKIELKKLKK